MTVCSCGYVFTEGDAFCVDCGRARASAPPVAPPPLAGDPSPFDADAAYLQQTLRHEPMELGLDDSVSLRSLAIIAMRAYIVWGIVTFVLGLYGVSQERAGNGDTWLILAFLIGIVLFWLVLLRSKVTEPIGEWRTLLPNRAGQAESYYRMINAVLKRRNLPIELQQRRVKLNSRDGSVKNTIVLAENEYQAYVTVFPYGTSLYVGWQMWRRRSGAQLVRRALFDRVTGANLVTAMLRTDRARAVREAVHLACREAVYAPADAQMLAEARQLQLPPVERETALLVPQQPASPVLPPPSATIPAPSHDPAPPTSWETPAPPALWEPSALPDSSETPAPPQTAGPRETRYE
ncbi:MAG: hypothetical protein ABSA02_20430 [Trebonia sp.]|jgi:hypothetical protein